MKGNKKLLLAVIAGLFIVSNFASAFAAEKELGKWKMSLSTWFAGASKYDEQPGANITTHVWGDFDTNFYKLALERELDHNIIVEGSYKQGFIKDNKMTIYTAPNTTVIDINGFINHVEANAYYRLFKTERDFVDVGLGYLFSHSQKNFSNQTTNGTLVQADNYGDFQMSYYGPQFLVRGRYMPLESFGVEGRFAGTTLLSNKVKVQTTSPSAYNSSGNYLGVDLRALWVPASHPEWEASFGFRHERVYFKEPNANQCDLTIVFEGLFGEVAYRF